MGSSNAVNLVRLAEKTLKNFSGPNKYEAWKEMQSDERDRFVAILKSVGKYEEISYGI